MKSSKKRPVSNQGSHSTPPPTKTAERDANAEKNLRLFSDATAQELSTVLATVVGELEFALTATGPQKERSVGVAINAAERALGLARNLRYFSLHTKLTSQVIDLSQVLLDSVELVEKELELAEIKIAVLAEASTYCRADAGAIQQIILNLLSHARKALPSGGKITLSLRQQQDQIEIKCSDNGPGMNDSELERAFEPHPNSDPNAGIVPQASGLGLAVSKALIEAHGGNIALASRVGTGTVVTLHLPYDQRLERPDNFSEERRFRRIHLNLPVQLLLSRGQATINSEISTLSIGGCFALISEPGSGPLPELNDSVSLRIKYFGDEYIDVPKGRIASVCWAGNNSGIGIEFLELDSRSKRLLAAIVKSHST